MNKYFLCGVVAGFAAGALMAPSTGLKFRKMLADNAKDKIDAANKHVDRVVDAAKRTKKAVQRTADGISDAFLDGKKTLVG